MRSLPTVKKKKRSRQIELKIYKKNFFKAQVSILKQSNVSEMAAPTLNLTQNVHQQEIQGNVEYLF